MTTQSEGDSEATRVLPGERWCIWLDVEGFSATYEQASEVLAIRALSSLLHGVWLVGSRCFPEPPDRLFAHQLGDGVAVLSDFHEPSLDRCLSIAAALMRHAAANQCVLRAGIAEGGCADVQGLYPSELLQAQDERGAVWMGRGLLTLTPVMGTALIRSVKVQKSEPKGPLLLVDRSHEARIGPGFPRAVVGRGGVVSVDWLRADNPKIDEVRARAGLTTRPCGDLVRFLGAYCALNPLPQGWKDSVRKLLGVEIPTIRREQEE